MTGPFVLVHPVVDLEGVPYPALEKRTLPRLIIDEPRLDLGLVPARHDEVQYIAHDEVLMTSSIDDNPRPSQLSLVRGLMS